MLNSRLLIVFSLLNLHLSILDFGLPVSFNHFFLKRRDHENDLQKVCECEGYCRLSNDYAMRNKSFEVRSCFHKCGREEMSGAVVTVLHFVDRYLRKSKNHKKKSVIEHRVFVTKL